MVYLLKHKGELKKFQVLRLLNCLNFYFYFNSSEKKITDETIRHVSETKNYVFYVRNTDKPQSLHYIYST